MNSEHRRCLVATNLDGPMKLEISFPVLYPDKVAPNFQFAKSSKTSIEWQNKILKVTVTAYKFVIIP